MGPNDTTRLALHASSVSSHTGGTAGHTPGTHRGETEPTAAAHLAGDLTEGFHTSWEAAWIDVGGEG